MLLTEVSQAAFQVHLKGTVISGGYQYQEENWILACVFNLKIRKSDELRGCFFLFFFSAQKLWMEARLPHLPDEVNFHDLGLGDKFLRHD